MLALLTHLSWMIDKIVHIFQNMVFPVSCFCCESVSMVLLQAKERRVENARQILLNLAS